LHARFVTLNLKPDRLDDLTEAMNNQLLPLLKKQTGFKDLITVAGPSRTKAVAISLWDKKESADSYNSTTYPEVVKMLSNFLEGPPQIEVYDVVASTLHKLPTLSAV